VLKTGIPWEYLPQEMGCGLGMTCWRRLSEWQEAGVWQRLHELLLLARLHEVDRIDWSRAAIDSSHVRAFGGRKDRPEPGRPLTTRLQASPDRLRPRHATRLLAHRRQPQRHHPDDLAARRDPAGARPPRPPAPPAAQSLRPPCLPLALGRSELRRRRIQAKIAWPKSTYGSGLGKKRWVVERTIAWLHQYRRLRIQYERRDDIHEAFLVIGCSLICLKLLRAEASSRSVV
jgi:transposase